MPTVLAICIGASLGALSRWQLAQWLNQGHAVLPWGTLAANWLGAWLIGLVVAALQALPDIDPVWRLALVTGFLGALTTFSTFSVEVVSLLQHGRIGLALANAALHLLGSLTLTWLGLQAGSRWFGQG
ncbi:MULTISPECIES: fluoride efflux transporter CrcB [Hydrogenophaga]|uniref:Fluoride-specific ion channel FluC n=1 Tax=Hydrogenophaga electricum TaxID=1230953 RepID=A0ABQ6C340_9BURK|nr:MULTISPECIES: fluoride efflux transporter CrcB [Hydrogenophaga]GLS14295.1 putative fluoride ion transporter CrcB [Hydrogenophaga electricum]